MSYPPHTRHSPFRDGRSLTRPACALPACLLQAFNDPSTGHLSAINCDMLLDSPSWRIIVKGSGPLGTFSANINGLTVKGEEGGGRAAACHITSSSGAKAADPWVMAAWLGVGIWFATLPGLCVQHTYVPAIGFGLLSALRWRKRIGVKVCCPHCCTAQVPCA